jgi:hypothetical protein
MRAEPTELLGLNLGDPVCRPIRLLLFRLSFQLACAAKPQRSDALSIRGGAALDLGPIP